MCLMVKKRHMHDPWHETFAMLLERKTTKEVKIRIVPDFRHALTTFYQYFCQQTSENV